MTDKKNLEDMFSEIGLGDIDSRKKFSEKIQFDFDYSKKLNHGIQEIVTSNNTKTKEICPTGTK